MVPGKNFLNLAAGSFKNFNRFLFFFFHLKKLIKEPEANC